VARVQEALRLSPKDARAYVWLTIAGTAKLCVRHQRMPATSSRRCKVSIARGPPLATRHAALSVGVGLDHAGIDREPLAANQPLGQAAPHESPP
jgi:hypothetical protein